jgi:outer membrane protein assembly factor BamB
MGCEMRRIYAILCCLFLVAACDKHDPILPGVRTPIFDTDTINVQHQEITDIPQNAYTFDNTKCTYTQDSNNVVWDGTRKIFSGFPTNNTVSAKPKPVCSGKYVYAGLSTGELVKINPKNRQIMWIADIYRASNMTGGASVVDIIAPIVPYENSVYVAGLGDAFCRVNATSGAKNWCVNIASAMPFVIADKYAFVVATDDNLYAISLKDGTVLWRSATKHQVAPTYDAGRINVGSETFNVRDGKKILDK